MKYFDASFDLILIRFYLMMAIIIGAFMADLPLLAFLAFPVLLSAILGVRIPAFKFSAKRALGLSQLTKSETRTMEVA